MDDRTVVCGLDRLGLRIVLALRALGEPVTVIAEAPGPGLPREAPAAGAKVVEGSAEDIGQLDEVDLRAARCLVLSESADLGSRQVAAAREVSPGCCWPERESGGSRSARWPQAETILPVAKCKVRRGRGS